MPSGRRAKGYLVLFALFPVAFALLVLMAQAAPEPVLTITNRSADPMVVAIDGERVRIIRGGAVESLELPIAIWSQPRRIEVYPYPDGASLFTWHADLNDLADQRWQLFIP